MTTYIKGTDNSAAAPAVTGTDGDTGLFFPAANTAAISTGGNEQLRIDSSGNVGIGTSSPAKKLELGGGNSYTAAMRFSYGSSAPTYYADWGYKSNGDGNVVFLTITDAGTARDVLVADYRGNLGLGVTPSAWASGMRAIDIGTYGGIAENSGGGGGTALYGNCYEYGANQYKYKDSYYATLYRSWAGQHQFYTAASGTAGNAITFTQAMTLDASGRVQIGATSAPTTTCYLYAVGGQYTFGINNGTYTWYAGTNGNSLNFYDGGGTLRGYLTSAGSFTNTSDLAFKKEIKHIQYGLADVLKMRAVSYLTKDNNVPQIGFIAQEMEIVVPEVVSGEEGSKGIAYGNITAVLVKAIQELKAELDSVKAELAVIKGA